LSEWTSAARRLLRARYLIYALVVLVLLVFRTIPSLRSTIGAAKRASSPEHELVVSGLDTAPDLIPRVVAYYGSLYPQLRMDVRAGGTIRAAEDLINQQADVAFLSRPLLAAEDSVVRALGDSLMIFPVAVSGTLVLAATSSPKIEAVSVGALRAVLRGRRATELDAFGGVPRVFVPDPALGLWGAVAGQLGLADTVGANILWVENDRAVVQAVAQDPRALGLVSALALGQQPMDGCRTIRVMEEAGDVATDPTQDRIAAGQYPLYHRLYAGCRVGAGAEAAAFVSFASGPAGQMLVRREGFLPAQEIAREIQLAERPVGMSR
jgi:ABC-type phosphate transport system substrate-binding protein